MANKKTNRTIVVFAKAPIPGEVKTRLMPFLSAGKAAALHRNLVNHTLRTMVCLPHYTVELWVGSQHSWWDELAAQYGLAVFEQRGENLGERMSLALENTLQRSEQVVIVGTDCPSISAQYLQQAFDGVEQSGVVIGPADDGGYVLLGLNRSLPWLFNAMPWGGDDVFATTVARLQQAELNWLELESLMDIDRPEDLIRLEQLRPDLTLGLGI